MGHDSKTEFATFCDGIRGPDGKLYHYTLREKLFVYHYLTDDRHVAYHAVEKAGYATTSPSSTRQMATEILRRPKIKAAINTAFDALVMPKFELLHRLSKIANGSVEDVLNDNDEFDMSHARRAGTAFLLKKVKVERDVIEVKSEKIDIPNADDPDAAEMLERSIIKEKVTFEIHDPLRAIELLGKAARLFVDNVQKLDRHGEPTDDQPTVVIHLPDNGRGDTTHKQSKTKRTRGTAETKHETENTGADKPKE